jgi:hypothetical protein
MNAQIKSALISIMLIYLSACSIHHPQSAEEFRQVIPTAFMGGVESFEVDRSFKDIGATFQKKAPQCLNIKIESVTQSNTSYHRVVTAYNPSVRISADKAEMILQQHHESGVIAVSEVPKGGYYLFVVDAIPLAKNKSKVDIYGPTMGYDTLIKAIKGWATGTNLGCPDLTR